MVADLNEKNTLLKSEKDEMNRLIQEQEQQIKGEFMLFWLDGGKLQILLLLYFNDYNIMSNNMWRKWTFSIHIHLKGSYSTA